MHTRAFETKIMYNPAGDLNNYPTPLFIMCMENKRTVDIQNKL